MALAPLTFTQAPDPGSAISPPFELPPSNVPLNLLIEWPLEPAASPWRKILAGSILLHVLLFFAAIRFPGFITPTEPTHRVIVRTVPLYLPPDLLTQREPNKQKVSKTIDLADLHPAPAERPREAAPPPGRRHFEIPQQTAPRKAAAKNNPQIMAEAPKVARIQPSGPVPPGVATGLPPAKTPPPAPGPFENIGSDAPLNPHPTLVPKVTVQAAIDALAQNARDSHLGVGDDSNTNPSPRVPGSIGQSAAPHAAVELQSDPQGADFKPYLMRILTIVRANWRRVVPESARMGALRGRTVMEFIIDRDGSIPKIVVANSSGSDPLDRAALAGLSMSNPLPPLPADYKGFEVRLAFTFSYNLPSQ